jgi:hypothetical protein
MSDDKTHAAGRFAGLDVGRVEDAGGLDHEREAGRVVGRS